MSQMLKLSQSKALGVRGKYAEDKVREVLKNYSDKVSGFDFDRNYDARSSMGRIPARAGDFVFYKARPSHGVIEVKQLAHEFRLPRKNFDPAKWGVLRKRQMAGGHIVVLIYHTPTKLWRVCDFAWFEDQQCDTSWDLRQLPTFASAKDALVAEGVFEC